MQKHASFFQVIRPYLYHASVQKMDEIAHHTKRISCLDHSLFVTYLSFVLATWYRGNVASIAKAALLHDLYLCDWRTTSIGPWQRLAVHPQMALENAACFRLTQEEENMIRKHMWPVATPFALIPYRKGEAIVSLADKICTLAEISGLYWLLPCCRMLRAEKRQPLYKADTHFRTTGFS